MKPCRSVLLVLACTLWIGSFAPAGTIVVGSGGHVKTIAEAARLAKDDDVVEITSGHYYGDVAVWSQKRLTIRGVGDRPVLVAAGKHAEGKAIWVIRNGDFEISNIEFRGARVADGNGAGIRFENGRLRVVNCGFFDNQMGILTANSQDAELAVENSVFAHAPQSSTTHQHHLYAGRIALLRVTGSRFFNGNHGHLLKSRARVSDIRYNLLIDGPGGMASYEADFPNAGDVTLVGNVLGQNANAENPTIVAYGAEGYAWPYNSLKMVHNTLVSDGLRPALFLRVFDALLDRPPEMLTRNNLLVGIGIFVANVRGHHQGNYFVPSFVLGNAALMDFSLGANSALRGLAVPASAEQQRLQPQFELLIPGQLSPIPSLPAWVPGAVQSPTGQRP